MKELDEYYDTYMKFGYEGQIVRINGPYENKRSNRLNAKTFQMPNILLLTSMRVMVIAPVLQRSLCKDEATGIFNKLKGTLNILRKFLRTKKIISESKQPSSLN